MQYWLLKSEPDEYSIDDLKRDRVEMWDGTRNYQVRNMMRDQMKVGDMALFYHSNAGDQTGVVGLLEIKKEAYPDPTQFDKRNKHYDAKSDPENPRWLCVDVRYKKKFKTPVYLRELKADPQFADMTVVQKGNRLSVMPVAKKHFDKILKLADA